MSTQSLSKRLAGIILLHVCNAAPRAKPALRRWGLRTRKEWFGHRPVRVQTPDGGTFKLASVHDNHLSFELFWKGTEYYEPISTLVAQELLRPGDRFLDVGANIGFYSLVLSTTRAGISVTAFEPNPKNFTLLRRNIAASRLPHVTCEPIALSDHDGRATLYLSESDMSASLRPDFEDHRIGSTEVQIAKLDTYVSRWKTGGHVLMKVDVEGHEAAFFRGAVKAIRTHAPDIITEVTVDYDPQLIAFFKREGYRFYQITDRGLPEAEVIGPVVRDRFVFLNYLLSRKSPREVDALYSRIAARVKRLDLTSTSKFLSPEAVAHFVARSAEAHQHLVEAPPELIPVEA